MVERPPSSPGEARGKKRGPEEIGRCPVSLGNRTLDQVRHTDDLRKLVGGAVSAGSSNTTPEEMAKELETYDMKVYKAQMQMVREMTARLRSLGVPFFGTRTELVRINGKGGAEEGRSAGGKGEDGMIDEIELVKLQKKMLALLEDLCSE